MKNCANIKRLAGGRLLPQTLVITLLVLIVVASAGCIQGKGMQANMTNASQAVSSAGNVSAADKIPGMISDVDSAINELDAVIDAWNETTAGD